MNITPPEKTQDLEAWHRKLESVRQNKIADPNLPESKEFAVREAKWEAEQAYYHDRFLYADRL